MCPGGYVVNASSEANDSHMPTVSGYYTIITIKKGSWPVQYAHDVTNNKMYYRSVNFYIYL